MRAAQPSRPFHTAHARLDRLQHHLKAAGLDLGLDPTLEAIGVDLDELLVLTSAVEQPSARSTRSLVSCVDRLHERCAVLEGAIDELGDRPALVRAIAAAIEGCAEAVIWSIEATPGAASRVA